MRRHRWFQGAALGMAVGVVALLLAGCNAKTEVTLAAPEQQSGIAVSGTGKVTVAPDIGVLSLGVQVTRPTVADARAAASKAMDGVRASLRQNGVEEKDIATQAFNIQPQYDFRPTGGTPTITGYNVSNQLSVKVRQIDNLSKVLDGAVAAGGNDVRVNTVQFTVDSPEKYQNEARDKAVADARSRAEQLAKSAGVKLGKPRSVVEGAVGGPAFDLARPMALAAPRAAGAASDTPVSPGEAQISVNVSVVFGIE